MIDRRRQVRNVLFIILSASGFATTASAQTQSDGVPEEDVHWLRSVAGHLESTVNYLDDFMDARWQQFSDFMGFGESRYIAAYQGYANDDQVWVRGRLLADAPAGAPQQDDNWWDNLVATYQRWASDELPGEMLELTYSGVRQDVVTDEEGYYSAVFDVDPDNPRTDTVLAEHHGDERNLMASHIIHIPEPDARFMLISDVDDTIIHTNNTEVLTSARLTFFENARTREPLNGVASLYQTLAQAGAINPVFYVSNSAWNLYDLLYDFLELNGLPAGPLLLRDVGIGDQSSHKVTTIRDLMERYPRLSAVLIGDSGQRDAEIYAQIATDFPDRVISIYIRDVDPGEDSEYDESVDSIIERSESAGASFLRVQDSLEIGRHLMSIGVLSEAALQELETAQERDTAPASESEEARL